MYRRSSKTKWWGRALTAFRVRNSLHNRASELGLVIGRFFFPDRLQFYHDSFTTSRRPPLVSVVTRSGLLVKFIILISKNYRRLECPRTVRVGGI